MTYTHSKRDGWNVVSWGKGSLIYAGTEIHMEGFGFTRQRVKELLGPIFEKFGFLTTRLEFDEDTRFVDRLGFEPTWRDENYQYYILTELRHGKSR